MERVFPDKSIILPIYNPMRLYSAASISDMINSKEEIETEIKTENAQFIAGLTLAGKIRHALNLYAALLNSHTTFTYLELRNRLPQIEVSPKAFIFLPKAQHYPILDDPAKGYTLTIEDNTASLEVEFAYGLTRTFGFQQIDKAETKDTAWLSPVVLLNVYGPDPRTFLMDITRIKRTQKASVAKIPKLFLQHQSE